MDSVKSLHTNGSIRIVAAVAWAIAASQVQTVRGQVPSSSKSSNDNPYSVHRVVGASDPRSAEEIVDADARERQANEAYLAGEKLFASGESLKAISKYREAVTAEPLPIFQPNAYIHLGDAYESVGRTEEAVTAYDKLWYRGHEYDPRYFCVNGTYRASALVKYARLLKKVGRHSDAYNAYRLALTDSDIGRDRLTAPLSDFPFDIDETRVESSDFDLACDLIIGASQLGSEPDKAVAPLMEVVKRRRYIAIAHYLLGQAIQRASATSPARIEAEKTTSWRAELKDAARLGSGEVKASAERLLK